MEMYCNLDYKVDLDQHWSYTVVPNLRDTSVVLFSNEVLATESTYGFHYAYKVLREPQYYMYMIELNT